MLHERPDGFLGQRMCVVPSAVLRETWSHPLLESFRVSDIGEFPSAAGHRRVRSDGAAEHIVIVCVAGEGWVESAGDGRPVSEPKPVRQGQALLIRRGHPHAYGAAQMNPWHILWAHVVGPAADAMVGLMDDPLTVIDADEQLTGAVRAAFTDAIDRMLRGYQLETLICVASAVRDSLVQLIYGNPHWHPRLSAAMNRRVDRLIDLMRRRISEPLTLDELAAEAELSRSHLSAVFRSRTGYPPLEYFRRLRVQTACRRLYATTDPVAAIGTSVGYDDQYYFSRTFRRIMGVSPREYRRSVGSERWHSP